MDQEQLVRCLLYSGGLKVLGFTQAIMGRWEGVEDVFQEACLLALAKSQEINDEPHLMVIGVTWPYLAAVRCAARAVGRRA